MARLIKHLIVALLLVLLAGCTSGGCSCSGLTPLPNGFATAQRIENAAAVRLTESGVAFLEENIGTVIGAAMGGADGGVVRFPVSTSTGGFDVAGLALVQYTVCPDGPDEDADPPRCVAELDMAAAQLDFNVVAPHDLIVSGPLPIRIQNLPIAITWLVFDDATTLVANGDGESPGTCPGQAQSFSNVQFDLDIAIEIDPDPNHTRQGYSRIRIVDLQADNADLTNAIHFCGGGFSSAIFTGLKDVMIGFLSGAIIGQVRSAIEQQLCQKASLVLDPACPNETFDVEGICRYGPAPEDECVSAILGIEGNVDLGALLSSMGGGAQGTFDLLLAAGGHSDRNDGTAEHWGDLNPMGGGATLGMYGGTEPVAPTRCVPLANVALPAGMTIPGELTQNTLAGWPSELPGPHVGIGISQTFFNYALAQMHNSGALCLGISGEGVSQLSTSLISVGLGAPSMAELGRMKQAQQIAVVTRPQQPFQVTFGNGTNIETDPLLRLQAAQFALDFYVWSLDRFVRVMTATTDLDIPVNLIVTPDGLQPVIDSVGVSNTTVTNSTLLREDPTVMAGALQNLVGSMVGSLLGDALPTIDLDAQLADLGLRLILPESVEGQGSPGLRTLNQDGESFLGIFAALEPALGESARQAETEAELVDVDLGDGDEDPVATLRVGSSLDDGAHRVQWQYRRVGQPWHSFTTERFLTVEGSWLRQPGRHQLEVRSRAVGDPMSLDPSPALVEITIDDSAPLVVARERSDGQVRVMAADDVSAEADTLVRYRLGRLERGEAHWDEWTAWRPAARLELVDPADADFVQVEARDEEGHVGTVSQALIRGKGSTDGSGCQCRLPRRPGERSNLAWLGAIMLGAVASLGLIRRRRRAVPSPRQPGQRRSPWRRLLQGLLLALSVVGFAGLWSGCSCEDDAENPGCRGRGDCLPLEPGLIGSYTSAAVAPDGTLWVSGYLEANWEEDYPWGDLAVGRYDGSQVQWQVVDGLPGEAVDIETFDPTGFRGGQIGEGDDVGLWTSLAIDPAGNPAVAYYDATHRALRYAHLQGGVWTATVVDQRAGADIGRYAKLLFVNGQPVISYMYMQPGDAGAVLSGVRVATGSSPAAAEVQWSLDHPALDLETPCRAALCPAGTRCVVSTGLCANNADGCGDCATDEECVDSEGAAQCEAIYQASKLDSYPAATGLYVSAAPHPAGGVGLAFYDRLRGNLVVATKNGEEWTNVIADGESEGVDTGDAGMGASLTIDDAGHFHVAYVEGVSETLRYVHVADGLTPGVPDIVDEGYEVAAQPFADGLHVVGDDTHIVRLDTGEIRISYQDATAGTLRLARGTPGAWTTSVLAQEGFAGAFSRQVLLGGAWQVVNFWRVATPSTLGDVRVLPAP